MAVKGIKIKKSKLCISILMVMFCTACGTGMTDPGSTAVQTPAVRENTGEFEAKPADGVIELSDFGMKITLPESVQDIPITVNGFVNDDYALANLCLADEDDPENKGCVFGEVYAYPDSKLPNSLLDPDSGMTEDMVMDLGTNETLYYYVLRLDELRKSSPAAFEKIMEGMSEEQKARYEALMDAFPDMISGMELTEMVIPGRAKEKAAAEEPLMNYFLQDMDGNEVRLGDLIFENRVTMLNAWGISCGPCLREMPYLRTLREKYKEQGFEIVGLTADLLDASGNIDPKLLKEAKETSEEMGLGYPVLAMPIDVLKQMKIYATPTTYFVNNSGRVIGKMIMGTRTESQWDRLIRDALEKAE